LGINIPRGACLEDLSVLISRAVDDDSGPNSGLIEYATSKWLTFSNYIGETALFNFILNKLPLGDKVAFFCFSIYRYLSGDSHINLDTSALRGTFYSFAQQYVSDSSFIESMEKYGIGKGGHIIKISGNGEDAGMDAYKTVARFLNTSLNTPLPVRYFVVAKDPDAAEKNPTAQVLLESEAEKKGYSDGYYLDVPGKYTIDVTAFDDLDDAVKYAVEHIGTYGYNGDDEEEYLAKKSQKLKEKVLDREIDINNQIKIERKAEKRAQQQANERPITKGGGCATVVVIALIVVCAMVYL
jgi:hypothetical protein